ncbi:hypothetical protein F4778DRAFT_198926 [Xylariomycetidae sp. FL2044]|nr:hypothetical protein F4778DRAFT_198926 [Xylariomycetidae sp. FL2044]
MANATESASRNEHASEPEENMGARTVPIITTPTPTPTIKMSAPSPAGEPMDVTTPTNSSAPQSTGKSSEGESSDSNERQNPNAPGDHSSSANSNSMPAPAAAAAAVHQPKIVQTAFIHKLYNMLEDQNIQHLISWSNSAESFVMSPSHDFSKVLAQYFKHTNISSFVRQLNMYGFHKVSDVFHTGNPETALWEFKHGNGNFKRGDLISLREIKRRASRHALVHREYNQKPTPSQPGTPAEPMPPIHDGTDPRLAGFEHTMYELSSRLQRSEETAQLMHLKQQAMVDTMGRMLQFNLDISRTMLSFVPPDNPAHRDVLALQGEVQRQADFFRTIDESHEPPFSGTRQYFANIDNPPVSPRQLAQDDQRRLGVHPARGANFYRPPVPSNLSISARRPYGSISGSTTQSSPSPLRAQPPPPPAAPHPLAHVEPPPGSLARRHTSADIRAHGWQATAPPYGIPGPPPTQWPPSPSRMPPDDHRSRETISQYSLSRPATPPAPFSNGNIGNGLQSLNNWSWESANGKDRGLGVNKDMSAPPTRRSSMVYILNPTDTAERDDEDGPRGDDDRKRKRMQ